MYRWQREFFESTNKYCTLVASNQSGKSTIQIRKAIRWATDKSLWPKLWKTAPIQFWYLYPDNGTATSEVTNKWVREFLPREEYKDDPVYGWKLKNRNGEVDHIIFNSGVTIYFKSYTQDVMNLQGGTVHAIFCDEEIPWELMAELSMRVRATDGYLSFAFTATRGQEEWRRIVEEEGKLEMWKRDELDILKIQVSAYDCLYYEDGTPSTVWSIDKIEETKKFLATEAQIQRRIMGRFVKDDGLKYSSFVRARHVIPKCIVDATKGHLYAALDYGSGTNHQSAVCIVWVNQEHTYGVVYRMWIGEKGIPTTAGDVIQKYQELSKGLKVTRVFYDWGAADLKTIGESLGLFMEKADKSHATGERILNTLFQNDQLKIMEVDDYEILVKQLETLTSEERKNHAWDDGADALRYAVTRVPWVHVNLREKPQQLPTATNKNTRHEPIRAPAPEVTTIDEVIDEWAKHFDFSDFDEFSHF